MRRIIVTAVVAVLACALVVFVLLRSGADGRVQGLDPAQVIVLRTPGGMLEVSTLVKNEEFGWQSSYNCPPLDCSKLLGKTVTHVRVPVHYTYRIPLAETWELKLQGDRYVLTVPAPQPKTPPSADLAKAEFRSAGQWTSPNKQEVAESMLRQLTPELTRRAGLLEYRALQRPHAEKTVVEFAEKWMAQQVKGAKRPVTVIFRDPGGA